MSTTIDQAIVEIHGEVVGLRSDFNKALNEVNRFENKTKQSFNRVGGAAVALKGAFAGLGVGLAGRALVKAAVDMETLNNKMLAATGNAEVAAHSMQFARAEADRLGVNMIAAGDGFAGFAAAALRSGLTLDQTKQIFSDMGDAATSLGLDTQRVGLIFRALEQISSKGVLSMEELKLQLGDSLPGALEIAARSMDVSTASFIKMVEAGEVMSKDFLPNFAAAIKEELGGSVEEASQSARANMNRLQNSFFDLKTEVANSGFMDEFNEAIQELTTLLKDPDLQEGLGSFAELLGNILNISVKAAAGIGSVFDTIKNAPEKGSNWLFRTLFGAEGEEALAQARQAKQVAADMQEAFNNIQGLNADPNAQVDGSFSLSQGASAVDAGAASGGKGGKGKKQKSALESALGVDSAGLAEELQELRDSFLTKEQLELEHNQRRLEAIQEFMESNQQMTAADKENLLALEEQYEKQKTSIKNKYDKERLKLEESYNKQVQNMRAQNIDGGISLLKDLVKGNKAASIAILAVEKGLAISRLLMNTEVAAMRALAELGPIAGAPVAAGIRLQGRIGAGLIAAQGLFQASQTGSSSSGSAAVGNQTVSGFTTADPTSTAPEQNQSVNITVTGRIFDQNTIREIVDGINLAKGDNVKIDFRD